MYKRQAYDSMDQSKREEFKAGLRDDGVSTDTSDVMWASLEQRVERQVIQYFATNLKLGSYYTKEQINTALQIQRNITANVGQQYFSQHWTSP